MPWPWSTEASSEVPDRVLGQQLRLGAPDGLGRNPPELPPVIVREYAKGVYRAEFVQPFVFEGVPQQSVAFSARHAGYPVSGFRRRGVLAVNAELESGIQFIAMLDPVR